jgi:phosphorylase kinase alpha/beta subunit
MDLKKKKVSHKDLLNHHIKVLKNLQYKTGLFAASCKSVGTGYDKSWLRDNFYEALAFQVLGDFETIEKTYRSLLEIFLKHESKIDHAIAAKPKYKHEYIHARFHPDTFDEFWEDWGNKQNDAVGAILFGVGILEKRYNKSLIENPDYLRIVNKLILYLESVKYYEDYDSGMWEEDEEIHASSVGACVAGLKLIDTFKGVFVPSGLIDKGEDTLRSLLPRESKKKSVDLALLSLIYPYNIVTAKERREILENVEYHLVKKRGVIRYKNDYYYNNNEDGFSEEAEWTFGFAWLAIIYDKLGEYTKSKFYINKLISLDTKKGLPELYFSNSKKFNENTPLGWSEAMFVIALHNFHEKHKSSSKPRKGFLGL